MINLAKNHLHLGQHLCKSGETNSADECTVYYYNVNPIFVLIPLDTTSCHCHTRHLLAVIFTATIVL